MKKRKALLICSVTLSMLTSSCGASKTSTNTTATADNNVVPAASMASARSGHTATLLANGKVLIAGGMERNGVFYDTAELYDPATNLFKQLPVKMTERRVGHSATLLRNGKVLIAGGWGDAGVLASAELYDPATNTFQSTPNMLIARGDFTATLLEDGRVLLTGGEGDHALASAEIYDPAKGMFTATGSMNATRTMHAAIRLRNGKVLITGGGEYEHPLATAELYDPATGAFTLTGNMTVPRYKQAALLLDDGNVIVVGGSDGRDWQGRYASAEIYDSSKGAFSSVGNMNTARFKLPGAVTLLKNGRVLIAGGGPNVEVYNPVTRTFTVASGQMDTARFYSTATLLSDGRVLIAGGYDAHSIASAKAWVFRA